MADALTPVASQETEPPEPAVVVAAAPPGCRNCDAPLAGRFCAACGQESKPLDPPVRQFANDFVQELFDVDNRALRSLRQLVFSPGFLTREHYEGRRARWLSPLKIYLLTSVAAFTAMAVTGSDSGLHVAIFGSAAGDPSDLAWVREIGYSSLEELSAAISAARAEWMPRVMFLLVPLFGWLISLARRRSGRHYPAHLVFALHVHAAAFAVRAAATVLAVVLPKAVAPWLDALVVIYAVVHVFVAYRRVYATSRIRSLLDLTLVAVVHWTAVMVLTGVVVFTDVVGPDWPAKLGLWPSG